MEKVSILFWRRNQEDSFKETSIMCRLTIDGDREEFTTNVKANNNTWAQEKQKVRGSGDEAYIANKRLSQIRNEINDAYTNLKKTNDTVTGAMIKYELDGGVKTDQRFSIVSMYEKEIKRLEANNRADNTISKLESSLNSMKLFLEETYKSNDYPIYKIDYQFIKEFEMWGRTKVIVNKKTKWKTNTLLIELNPLKRIVNECFQMGVIKANPFFGHKIKKTPPAERYLSPKEVQQIEQTELSDKKITTNYILKRVVHTKNTRELTRDCFLFCCYTGLAYVDLKNLTHKDIVEDPNFGLCISTKRQKTKVPTYIPLLKKPLEILEKYRYNGENLFPVERIGLYNERLTLLQEECGLEKKLSSHVGRHTAATFFLNNKIPEPIICAAIAISPEELRRTYGKILKETISMHFNDLNNR